MLKRRAKQLAGEAAQGEGKREVNSSPQESVASDTQVTIDSG